MNKKILFFCVLFFSLSVVLGLSGCKKEKPADTPQPPEIEVVPETEDIAKTPVVQEKTVDPKNAERVMKDLEANDSELAEKFARILEDAEKQTTVQTICPVAAGQINKEIFVEYQGQKVYFCCEACKTDFNADPAKYLANLPQFKK